MATKLPEASFNIIDGPSKFDFMNSLFDQKNVKVTCRLARQAPSPTMKIDPVITVNFQCIAREDGSGESWYGTVLFVDEFYETERRSFYYSSKTRKGVIHQKGATVSV